MPIFVLCPKNSLKNLFRHLLLLGISCSPFISQAAWSQDFINGTPFTLTNTSAAPNGVWSWFEDERAVIDSSNPSNPRLLVSSVSAGSGSEAGDVDLLWRDLTTGNQGHFELADRLEQDDHNSAALYIRPDGRYLAMYSRHITDSLTRWRVSTNPNDPTSWGAEQTLNNGAGTTYNNTYYLPGDNGGTGITYNFTRTTNFDPNVQVSYDNGSSWENAGKLLTEGGGGDRPYLRYAASNDKIFFMATDRHPRDFQNSVYSGYVQDGKLFQMDGTLIDNSLFDNTAVAPSDLTNVFNNGSQFNGTTMNRAWTINLEVDNTGNPVGIFSARANDNANDHRFFYSRFDGIEWQVHEMAQAGGFLYAAENDYTGLVSIDPNNPNVVYMSTDIHPDTNVETGKYELYKGVTKDFGKTWEWSALTADSTVDNLRPVVPDWNGENTVVTWLRGNYSTYTNWDTEVVGLQFEVTDPKSLLWNGTSSSTWDGSGTHWDSGGSALTSFNVGDEVAFDDSAASTNVVISSTVTPMGVAFNNRQKNYELSGAGIAGSGGLRVIGGGTVTLANAANTYTGKTMIGNGTLALSGETSIAGTSEIAIHTQGVLDVTGTTSGSYALAGQRLTNAGEVRGNLLAQSGSSIDQAEAGIVSGNLSLEGSSFVGSGTINGNLVATNGSVIRVGSNGITGTRQMVYVDATHGPSGNTSLSDGQVFNPTTNPDWQIRSPFANGGVVYQGGSNDPNSAAELVTVIDGLTPGESYQAYVNYWDASGSTWRILAGSESGNLTLFDSPFDNVAGALNGIDPLTLNYGVRPLTAEGNRLMWAGNLGQLVADANGRIAIYVDDTGTADGDDRTWYDGITYQSDLQYSGQATLAIAGDLLLDSDTLVQLDIADPFAFDRISVDGAIVFGGTLEVQLASGASPLVSGDAFDLFDFTSSTGQFSSFVLPSLSGELAWDISSFYDSGIISVTTQAVPEPSAVALLGLAVVSLASHRRRRALPGNE